MRCTLLYREIFYFNDVSFESKFLKNLKRENFKSISSFIKRIKNLDVLFNVLRVIVVILTNNQKILNKI